MPTGLFDPSRRDRAINQYRLLRILDTQQSLAVRLQDGGRQPGTQVSLKEYSGSPSQLWRFQPVNLELTRDGDEITSTTVTTTTTTTITTARMKEHNRERR